MNSQSEPKLIIIQLLKISRSASLTQIRMLYAALLVTPKTNIRKGLNRIFSLLIMANGGKSASIFATDADTQ